MLGWKHLFSSEIMGTKDHLRLELMWAILATVISTQEKAELRDEERREIFDDIIEFLVPLDFPKYLT